MNPEKAEGLSPELQAALEPWLAGIDSLSEQIRESNQRIECLAWSGDAWHSLFLVSSITGAHTILRT